GGYTFGIEFTGGSQFQVHLGEQRPGALETAEEAVSEVLPGSAPRVTQVGPTDVRVQLEALEDAQNQEVSQALTQAFDLDEADVTYSFIGPAWGQDITQQAIIGLVVFIVFAALVMALYFRTWKMSLAALG